MKVSAENECVTIFIKIMHVGVPAAILKVVFSAVHQAHEYFYCNYTGDCVTVSSSNFIILSLTDTHSS